MKKTNQWIVDVFVDVINALVEKKYLYIIRNNSSGCYQLAFRRSRSPNTALDSVWELEVKEFNG